MSATASNGLDTVSEVALLLCVGFAGRKSQVTRSEAFARVPQPLVTELLREACARYHRCLDGSR